MFLGHDKGKGQRSHPKLCRWYKEDVAGIFYLHELASKKADAGLCECMEGRQQEPFTKKPLPPETDV